MPCVIGESAGDCLTRLAEISGEFIRSARRVMPDVKRFRKQSPVCMLGPKYMYAGVAVRTLNVNVTPYPSCIVQTTDCFTDGWYAYSLHSNALALECDPRCIVPYSGNVGCRRSIEVIAPLSVDDGRPKRSDKRQLLTIKLLVFFRALFKVYIGKV